MKRDMDLARQILMNLDSNTESTGLHCVDVTIEGHSPDEISYHVMLLDDAGLLKAKDASDGEGLEWMPMRLTSQGHDFLEAAKEEGSWQKAKEITKKTGGLSFDVLKAVLVKLATEAAVAGVKFLP